jgi:hypothetical protein
MSSLLLEICVRGGGRLNFDRDNVSLLMSKKVMKWSKDEKN